MSGAWSKMLIKIEKIEQIYAKRGAGKLTTVGHGGRVGYTISGLTWPLGEMYPTIAARLRAAKEQGLARVVDKVYRTGDEMPRPCRGRPTDLWQVRESAECPWPDTGGEALRQTPRLDRDEDAISGEHDGR